jgi:hypothetical protein
MHTELWEVPWKNDHLKDSRKLQNNIKIDITEIGHENKRWMELGKNHVKY